MGTLAPDKDKNVRVGGQEVDSSNAKMVCLSGMRWGYTGSLDMLEYEVMRSLMSSQGAALFWGFMDLSRPWESLDEIYEKGLVAGWSAGIGYDGEVLVIPKDRLKN
jgi:hypothetical protein